MNEQVDQDSNPYASVVWTMGKDGKFERRELSLEETLEDLFDQYGTGPEVQAVAKDMRAGTLKLCPCCVIAVVQGVQDDQARLRKKYGASWHNKVHMRRLRSLVNSGYPKNSEQDRDAVSRYVKWLTDHRFAEIEGGKHLSWR